MKREVRDEVLTAYCPPEWTMILVSAVHAEPIACHRLEARPEAGVRRAARLPPRVRPSAQGHDPSEGVLHGALRMGKRQAPVQCKFTSCVTHADSRLPGIRVFNVQHRQEEILGAVEERQGHEGSLRGKDEAEGDVRRAQRSTSRQRNATNRRSGRIRP